MIVKTKNQTTAFLRKMAPHDYEQLCEYLGQLSLETRSRFEPHPFDLVSVSNFYKIPDLHTGYIAQSWEDHRIIAYAIIRKGFLEHDAPRLQSYGLNLNHATDISFAPSVADEWQSQGLGSLLFQFILQDLKTSGSQRIILWGGVQAGNEKAVKFYLKNGFRILGSFEYNGPNYDMMLDIAS